MDLPRDLAGCYELHRAKELYYAPPRLRLNADTLTGPTRRFVDDPGSPAWTLVRLDASGRPMEPHEHNILYWQQDGRSDSLQVTISSGHSGTVLSLDLPASNDTLRGRATEHWDFGPPFSNPGGPVSLVRIPCLGEPSSHPDPGHADRSAPPRT